MSAQRKLKRCQEVVTGNGHSYLFAGTFGNVEAVSFACDADPGEVMRRLYDGETPPGDIRSVILCCMEERDNEPVTEHNREEYALEFIEDMGLQDASALAQHLLSFALIGDVKKKQIASAAAIRGMLWRLNPSTLMGFAALGSLWAATTIASALLVCLILRYF